MKSALFWQVYERLAEDSTIESLPQRLVEAAFSGDKAIDGVLGDTAPEVVSQPTDAPVEAASEAIYLDKLEVTGFRGVGETTVVHFGKEPGLTLIVGRNGSGKSSLAEALEVLLTGDSLRWKNRKQKEWASGWKNLHQDGRTWIRGTFLGTGLPLQVTRSWDTEEYDDGTLTVDNEPAETIARWAESLETFRPMLSYNEMGTALDGGPSHLYDLLRGVLGMEALTRAGERLATARKRLALIDKGRKKLRDELDAKLNNADDDRVEAVRTALGPSKPDIDALLALIEAEAVDDTQVSNLRRVASIQLPNSAAVLSCSSALRDADSAYQLASRELGGLEAETVEILKLAVRFHDHSPGADCPVCGADGALDDAWNQKALEHVAKLESSTEAHKRSKSQLDGALRQAQQLITRTPSIPGAQLASADAANSAHQNWLDAPKEPLPLANHLEDAFDALEGSYDACRDEARDALRSLQAEWRPIRHAIEAFVDSVQEAAVAKPKIKAIKAAEAWLKEADVAMRIERFAPIRDKAQAIWDQLRHRSNVSLSDIRLEGSKTRRRVELDVAVDGREAVALGVMSQGELHAMLLALFLPRLTLPESPFRFLVIDDPVQAMDPAKVDGLAQVLSQVAKDRQVVVFTHDARLPAALQRMQIPARVVEVTRAENSVVSLRDVRDRPSQFLADAWQVTDNQHEFGPTVAARVVPGLCRGAVEAFLQSEAWRRLLGDGREHTEVADQIASARGVHNLAALALLGDVSQGGAVFTFLNNKIPNGAETLKALKEGAHGEHKGDVRDLVLQTQRLLQALGANL